MFFMIMAPSTTCQGSSRIIVKTLRYSHTKHVPTLVLTTDDECLPVRRNSIGLLLRSITASNCLAVLDNLVEIMNAVRTYVYWLTRLLIAS